MIEAIGRGGMGEVYRAWDEQLGRPVAVKALSRLLTDSPRARKRFVRETRLACRVSHPFVATVHDVVEDGDDLLLVMEYIDGDGLDETLREQKPTLRQITTYGIEVSEALEAIHTAGLVHRDLKPSNVMVTTDGHVKVTDFGVALPLAPPRGPVPGEPTPTEPTLTEEGAGAGTLAYMSPEQVRGEAVDGRSDLFSLGVLLYEAVAGTHPFRKESVLATAGAIVQEPPGGGEEPPTLTASGPLRQVILRLLEKRPSDRYQRASQVAGDLRAIVRGEEIEFPTPVPAGPLPIPARGLGRRALPVAAALAVLALAVGAWRFVDWYRSRPPEFVPPPGPPTLVVLPFAGPDDQGDSALRGSLVASLIRIDLAEDSTIRVVGSTRTDELFGGFDPGSGGPTLARLLDAVSAQFLVRGSFQRERGVMLAAVEIFDRREPDRTLGLRAEADTTAGLVEQLTARIRSTLGPRVDGSLRAKGVAPPAKSEAALVAAERGRRAMDRGALSEATAAYDEAIEEDPDYARAYMERARALYKAGYVQRAQDEVARASELIDRLGASIPRHVVLELDVLRATVHQDAAGAVEAGEKLVAAYPQDTEARIALSEALVTAQRNDEALETLTQLSSRSPHDPTVPLLRARVLRRVGRFAESAASLDEAGRLSQELPGHPFEARIAMERGGLAFQEQRFDDARARFSRAAVLFAARGEPLNLARARLGEALINLAVGDLARAAESFQSAANSYEEAGNDRDRAIQLNHAGASLLQIGETEAAEKALRDSWKLMERTGGATPNVSPLLNLSTLLVAAGRLSEARTVAEKAATLAKAQGDRPRQAHALLSLAEADAEDARMASAEKRLREVLTLFPKDSPDERVGEAWRSLADVLSERGDLDGALDAAGRAVERLQAAGRKVNLGIGLLTRARIRRIRGDNAGFHGDLEELDRVLAETKPPPELIVERMARERGLLASEEGRREEAESWLKQSSTPRAHGALGLLLCRSGNHEQGLRDCTQAREKAHGRLDSMVVRNDLAACEVEAGHTAEGRDLALRVLDEAESLGLPWEAARAAATAVAAMERHPPEEVARIRARGRRQLEIFSGRGNETLVASLSRRPEFRRLKELLAPRQTGPVAP